MIIFSRTGSTRRIFYLKVGGACFSELSILRFDFPMISQLTKTTIKRIRAMVIGLAIGRERINNYIFWSYLIYSLWSYPLIILKIEDIERAYTFLAFTLNIIFCQIKVKYLLLFEFSNRFTDELMILTSFLV